MCQRSQEQAELRVGFSCRRAAARVCHTERLGVRSQMEEGLMAGGDDGLGRLCPPSPGTPLHFACKLCAAFSFLFAGFVVVVVFFLFCLIFLPPNAF